MQKTKQLLTTKNGIASLKNERIYIHITKFKKYIKNLFTQWGVPEYFYLPTFS